MKTVIAGSRSITGYILVEQAIALSGFHVTEVVSGGAVGVDRMGERWAKEHGVPVRQFIPEWDRLGKAAGFIRNTNMALYAEAVIVLWDGKSKGSKHMIDAAKRYRRKLFVLNTSKIEAEKADESEQLTLAL